MDTTFIEISQFDTLTKFHRGIDRQEALVMVGLLNQGQDLCIVSDDNDAMLITRWEVIRTKGVGQLLGVSESEYEHAKANNFQPHE